jgi:hypothetical protein
MKVSRAKHAYKDGRPTFKTRRRPGVYLIYINGLLRYVGYSTYDVYKTMYRHFQSWRDSTQTRITYPRSPDVKIRVVYTNTAKQAAILERALRIRYQPTDNPQQLINIDTTPAEDDSIEKFEQIRTYTGADPF